MRQFFTKPIFYCSLFLCVFGRLPQAVAQAAPASKKTKYIFQPAKLPEAGGPQAIVRAIQQRVVYPRLALRYGEQGQNQVTFAVAPNGQVGRVTITRSLRADLDTAVVFAVRELPRMTPALQNGKPVACLFMAPVTFVLDEPLITSAQPIPRADSTQRYAVLEQMPQYQGKLGYQQLGADLTKEYLSLLKGTGCFLPRLGLSVLLTISPSGFISDVQIIKCEEREKEALSAAYGDAVAREDELELPASCVTLVVQAAKRLSRLTPAYLKGRYVATQLQISMLNPN